VNHNRSKPSSIAEFRPGHSPIMQWEKIFSVLGDYAGDILRSPPQGSVYEDDYILSPGPHTCSKGRTLAQVRRGITILTRAQSCQKSPPTLLWFVQFCLS
jgi:hypothetical protein